MPRLMILCWLATTTSGGLRAQPSSSPPGFATDARAGELWVLFALSGGIRAPLCLLQLFAHYYPWQGSSWFVGAGIGSASYGAYNRYTPAPLDAGGYPLDSRVYGSGVGITLTVGNEVSLSPSVDLLLALNALFGNLPEFTLNERRLLRSHASPGILYFSAGIRFHS